jgi:hypothetical protein
MISVYLFLMFSNYYVVKQTHLTFILNLANKTYFYAAIVIKNYVIVCFCRK